MDHGLAPPPRGPLVRLEYVILWTMRAWVMGIVERIPVEEQICDAFRQIGVPGGTAQIYEFMWLLSQGACRTINIDCVCRPAVSEDERRLLDILALAQRNKSFEALMLLRTMLAPRMAVAAAESAARLAEMLGAEGVVLPAPALVTERYLLVSGLAEGRVAEKRQLH